MTPSRKKRRIFIFGSTGDLVKRKVLPALFALTGFDVEIIALGRRDLTTETYWDFATGGKQPQNTQGNHAYLKVNLEDDKMCENCDTYLSKKSINFFYSALPPQNTTAIIGYLDKIKCQGYKVKLLTEKPFGSSLADAIRLKKIIQQKNMEEDVLISDHYLFKKEIVDLKRRPFKKLKIVSIEEVGLENRAGYYDDIGALKDMIQSHFLNIAFKLVGNSQKEFRNFDVTHYLRGQYGDGKTNGYTRDLGKHSDTETFVHVIIKTDHKEFEFITGKKFNEKSGYLSLDDTVIRFNHHDNPYVRLFKDFFLGKRSEFATIESSIIGWQVTEAIQKKKSPLTFYQEMRPDQF